MSTRARYEGDVSAIAGVLSAFMSGPGSITYGKDGGKKLDKRLLQRHGRLVRGLHNLQEHWSFRVGDLKKAIKLVGEEKQWGLTKKELDEVVQHIPRRVQLLCRHVSQASTRKPPPAWFDDMMADEGDTGEDLAAVIVEEGKEEKEASDEGDTGEGAPAPAFFRLGRRTPACVALPPARPWCERVRGQEVVDSARYVSFLFNTRGDESLGLQHGRSFVLLVGKRNFCDPPQKNTKGFSMTRFVVFLCGVRELFRQVMTTCGRLSLHGQMGSSTLSTS